MNRFSRCLLVLAVCAGWLAPAGGARAAVAGAAPGDSASARRTAAAADPEPYFFYHRLNYGSESLGHPLRMIINSGYGIFQVGTHDRRPFKIDYDTGATNLWRNMRDPFGAIQHEGWWQFLQAEVIPISFDAKGARYWPNYTQHLIGGGMSYRLIGEWFRAHDWPHPRWYALGTMLGYHVLNEIVENNSYVGWTTDPVADLYIFDPAGVLLFSSDRVSRFFGETLHMADWSYQLAYDPWRSTLENGGQNYVLKLGLPHSERWSLFYYYGTHGEVGLSYTRPDGSCWSAGAGLVAGQLVELGDGVKTVDLVPSAGIFYDRNNSLLASVYFAQTQSYRWRLNLYPGLIRLKSWAPGFFTAIDHDGRVVGGLTVSSNLPLGLAF
ncbi:MAG: hypothetical protein ACYDIE_00425 [Candidatus Krumholzibacteriia bacterium]